MNLMYGFSGEVKAKYDAQTMDLFAEIFQASARPRACARARVRARWACCGAEM